MDTPKAHYSYDSRVQFTDEKSVDYWKGVFRCSELQLRNAAAQLGSSDIAVLRPYLANRRERGKATP